MKRKTATQKLFRKVTCAPAKRDSSKVLTYWLVAARGVPIKQLSYCAAELAEDKGF